MIDGVKIIDTDFNAISSLNGAKMAKVSQNVITGMKNLYCQDKSLNTNFYRMQAEKVYKRLSWIKPIDNKIDDVIFVKKDVGKGIVIPLDVSSIKKAWTYYRLIYNEHNTVEIPLRSKKKSNSSIKNDDSYVLNNFDALFDKLSQNISGVDLYVKELEDMQKKLGKKEKEHETAFKKLDTEKNNFDEFIAKERKALEEEKKAFAKEKEIELKKIEKANNELAIRFKKLQELTEELNKKIAKLSK